MTADQAARLATSWQRVGDRRDAFARDLLEQIFAADPPLRALFKHDLQMQACKLAATLSVVVSQAAALELLHPVLEQLALRHLKFGVHAGHYDHVAPALDAALRRTFGADGLAADEAEAWAVLARELVATMQRAVGSAD